MAPAPITAATLAQNEPVTDFLDEDIITVPGQTYALVSFVGPQCSQQSDKCAMKIRGVFATMEEASNHVKKLMRLDNSFDIYVMDLYKWVPVPPNPNDIQNQEYTEPFLNDLIKGYKESQLAAKQHFAERKRAVMEKGLDANLLPEERVDQAPGPSADSSASAGPSTSIPDVFNAPDTHPSASKAPHPSDSKAPHPSAAQAPRPSSDA